MEHTFLFSKISSSWKIRLLLLSSNYSHEVSLGIPKKCVHYPKMGFPEFHDKWKAFPNSDQGMFLGKFTLCHHKLCSACIWKGRQFFGETTHGLKWKRKQNIPAKKVYFVFSAGKLQVFRFGKWKNTLHLHDVKIARQIRRTSGLLTKSHGGSWLPLCVYQRHCVFTCF